MPRRTPLLTLVALALGLLLAVGLSACGGGESPSAESLEKPPLTVPGSATLPAPPTGTTSTATTTATPPADATGGATDAGSASGGATGTSDGTTDPGAATDGTDAPAPADTGGGATDAGGETPTPAEPSNPGGAAPNLQRFCDQNPGAC